MTRAMRGFSLIEILMVVTIIGILSVVVVSSISTARNRGIDASVKENLHTIRNQAELFYANAGRYGTQVAVQGTGITAAPAYNASGAHFLISDRPANSALRQAIQDSDTGFFAIGVNGQTWAAAVSLKTVEGYWCVDANAEGKVITTASLGGGTSAARCP